MKKTYQRILTLLIAVIISLGCMVIAYADDATNSVVITADAVSVNVRKTLQMTATVTATDGKTHAVTWSSSNISVATVDVKGIVTGKSVGKVLITAKVEDLNVSDSFVVYVVKNENLIYNLLQSQQILGYRYSYNDNYYYTDDKDCWQSNFGFTRIYDLVSPYILLEYDYTRVFFTYEGKDWMIQLWKGQYGLLFFGSEVGVYTKKASDKEHNVFTHFACASEEDWLDMDMTLYHDEDDNGDFKYQLSRPRDKYWWCTGFKSGHLKNQEPADELRMDTTITLKDAEMTTMFTKGLVDCGFKQTEKKDDIPLDSFYVEGNDVHILWQNISEAENTMAIKYTAGAFAFAGVLGFFLTILLFMGMAALGGFLIFII